MQTMTCIYFSVPEGKHYKRSVGHKLSLFRTVFSCLIQLPNSMGNFCPQRGFCCWLYVENSILLLAHHNTKSTWEKLKLRDAFIWKRTPGEVVRWHDCRMIISIRHPVGGIKKVNLFIGNLKNLKKGSILFAIMQNFYFKKAKYFIYWVSFLQIHLVKYDMIILL